MEDENTYTITGGPLRPHEYVVVKREMTAADEAWIQNHSTSITGSKKNPQVQLTVGDVKLAALKRMIVRWQLTKTAKGHDGSESQVGIELSAQAIENLPRRVSAYINKVIDELNPEDEEEENEVFSHAANGHSGGSLARTRIIQSRD